MELVENGVWVESEFDDTPFQRIRKGKRAFYSARRSKLVAYIVQSGSADFLPSGGEILYLGAGNGYSVSFLSETLNSSANIYAVEISRSAMKDVVKLASCRPNIHAIFHDANRPENYMGPLPRVDWIFQDVSQRNQADIFVKNCRYLKTGCQGVLSLKLESLTRTKRAKEHEDDARAIIESIGRVIDVCDISRFEKKHLMLRFEKTV